jgi:predicted TIM-barrel fold metal-dependent hydrolase
LNLDAHIHIGSGRGLDGRKIRGEPEYIFEMMDEADIAKSVALQPRGVCSPKGTNEGWKKGNDFNAEMAKKYDRFIPFACVEAGMPGDVEELKRAINVLGLKGLKILPAPWPLIDHPKVFPLIRTCADLGIPVTIHTDFNYHYMSPFRIMRLAERFPEVPIIMAHMGMDPEFIFHFIQRKDVIKRENVYLECSGTPGMPYLIEKTCEMLGAERMIFGSDSPTFNPGLAKLKVELTELSDDAKKLVLGGNIARILGIWEVNS